MSNLKEINISDFSINPFSKIGNDWMLITAKKGDKINTMTASWGGFGVMWFKNISFMGIRPQRYTKEFIDSSDKFSLCFFAPNYKETLSYLGTVSGRDENKIEKSGLTITTIDNIPIFEEANMVIVCKKLYKQKIDSENFIQKDLNEKCYPNKDYHDFYISEVEKILIKE